MALEAAAQVAAAVAAAAVAGCCCGAVRGGVSSGEPVSLTFTSSVYFTVHKLGGDIHMAHALRTSLTGPSARKYG